MMRALNYGLSAHAHLTYPPRSCERHHGILNKLQLPTLLLVYVYNYIHTSLLSMTNCMGKDPVEEKSLVTSIGQTQATRSRWAKAPSQKRISPFLRHLQRSQ